MRQIDDVWCIVIDPKAGRVKTRKKRIIPIHPHLIEQVFLEFAGRKQGVERLFYKETRDHKASEQTPQFAEVGARLSMWVRKLGIDADDVDPNHGWCHRFKARALVAGILEPTADQIQGHAPKTAGGRYGPYEPTLLYPEICKLPRYEVDIPDKRGGDGKTPEEGQGNG